jgi:DNA-binding GntR family transcriptional regulator
MSSPPRQPLSPLSDFSGSLAQKAYASLKDAILTLKFHPGEALRKPEICEELGVSRAPLGEALARLAAEDLSLIHI